MRGSTGVAGLVSVLLVGAVVTGVGCKSAGRRLPSLFSWQSASAGTLAQRTQSADPDRRREAALALGRSRLRGEEKEQVRELLATLLRQDGEPLVRAAAAVSLGRLGGEASVAALAPALTDSSALVRADVCRGLGMTGADSAVEPLVGALKRDEDVDVRGAAARALGNFRGPRAREALLEALEADRLAVRTAAWQALRQATGAKKLPPERAAWEKWFAEQDKPGKPRRRRFLLW